ncbi:hypothetical protein D3C83_09030 [compost metagenome]
MQLAPQLAHELRGRRRRAAGREHVVDDEDLLARADGVLVDLERVLAVLEVVRFLEGLRWQLAGLADRYEARADAMRDGPAEDEPAALDADDRVDPAVLVRRRQHVDGRPVALRIAQQRRDVVEEDAGLREVGNAANVLFEVHAVATVRS